MNKLNPTERLQRALKHLDPHIRYEAIVMLGKIQPDNFEIDLNEVLADENEGVRGAAAETAGRLGLSSAVPGLVKLIKDANPEVRVNALEALGIIGDSSVVPAVIEALRDDYREVREEAIWALKYLGTDSAVAALTELLPSLDEDIP